MSGGGRRGSQGAWGPQGRPSGARRFQREFRSSSVSDTRSGPFLLLIVVR